jgi:hypothetical protein
MQPWLQWLRTEHAALLQRQAGVQVAATTGTP